MKRFILLFAFTILGIGCITLAAKPKEKKVVKIEVSSIVNQTTIDGLTIITVSNLNSIINPSGYVVTEFKPPTVIVKIDNILETSISSAISNVRNFLPDIRRLSCNSLVAASDKHI